MWLESLGHQDVADTACLKLWGVHALVPEPELDSDALHTAHLAAVSNTAILQRPLLPQQGYSSGFGFGPSSKPPSGVLPHHGGSAQNPMQHLPPRFGPSQAAWDSPRYAGWGSGSSSSFAGSVPGLQPMQSALSDPGVWGGDGDSEVQGRRVGAGAWDSIFARQYRWMVLLALGLPLLQQASGINTVVYYSSQVRACVGQNIDNAAQHSTASRISVDQGLRVTSG